MRGVVLLVLFLFALGSSYHVVNLFFTRQVKNTPEVNNLCKESDAPRFCKNSKGPLQFDKFIWFVTDGLPVQYSDPIFQWFNNHATVYGIDVPGAKYSHAIYTSWLTGQLPTNYHGAPIQGDQLLSQMTRSGFSLKYAGPEWSFLAINGKQNYDRLFTGGIDIHNEPLDGTVKHSYPFFFENQTTLMDFQYSYWPNLVENNHSLIAHSGVFDHINHGVFRNNGDTQRLRDHSVLIAQDLARIKALIDANPDYLLILSSDHGIDAQTSAGYVLHGFTKGGNEGYLLFYNPAMQPYRARSMIDVVDVAPTISKYLTNVDIPYNSVGHARNYYGTDSSALKQNVNILKQNLVQLKHCTTARGKLQPISDESFEKLLKLPAKQESIQELSIAIGALKSQLYNVMDAPLEYCAAYCIALVVIFVASITTFHGGRSIFQLPAIGWLVLLGIYIAPLMHLLFALEFYGNTFSKGTCFFLPNSLLTTLAIYLWYRQLQYDQTGEEMSDISVREYSKRSSVSLFHHVSIKMLLSVFVINWIELAITLLFGASWKVIFSAWWLSTDLVYFIAALFLLWTHTSLKQQKQHIFQRTSLRSVVQAFFNPSFIISIVVLLLFRLYEATEGNTELYVLFGGIHQYVVIAAAIGLVWLMLWHVFYRSSIHGLVIAIHFFVFLLWMDSPTGRLLNLLWHMKNVFMYLPLIEVAYTQFQFVSHRRGTSASQQRQEQESIILIQCVIVLLVNQAFYHLGVTMGDRISMDLHPFSGKVGVQAYDLYPIIAGFMMCFHKYGYLAIFFLYALLFVTSEKIFFLSELSPLAKGIEAKEIHRLLQEMKRFGQKGKGIYWNFSVPSRLRFVVGVFGMYQVAAVASYFVLLVNYSPAHNIEGSAIYAALWGTICCCFLLFYLIESIFQFIRSVRAIPSPNQSTEMLFDAEKEHSI